MKGMAFGDVSLVRQEPRSETAITVAISELLTLSRSDLNKTLI